MRLSIDDLEALSSALRSSADACSQAAASANQGAGDIEDGGLSGQAGQAAGSRTAEWASQASQAADSLSGGADGCSTLAEQAKELKGACEAVPEAFGAFSGAGESGVVDVEGSAEGLIPQASSDTFLAGDLKGLLEQIAAQASTLSQGSWAVGQAAESAAAQCWDVMSKLDAYSSAVSRVCGLASQIEASGPSLFGESLIKAAPDEVYAFAAWYDGLTDSQKALVAGAAELFEREPSSLQGSISLSYKSKILAFLKENPNLSAEESIAKLGLSQDGGELAGAFRRNGYAFADAALDSEHPRLGSLGAVGKAAGVVGVVLTALDFTQTYQDKREVYGEAMSDDEAGVRAGAEATVDVVGPAVAGAATGALLGSFIPGLGTAVGGVAGAAIGAAVVVVASGAVSYSLTEFLHEDSLGQALETKAGDYAVAAYDGVKSAFSNQTITESVS